jgi:microcystin-dependent protein
MTYNITLTNGTDLIVGGLLDNTTDSVNSSLTLVGKNFKSYGLFLNQNFVRLMENFALASAPTSPLPGQLWFNSSNKLLNVNIAATKGSDSAVWKSIAGMTLSSATPTNAYTGELWYNTGTGQIKIYTGAGWELIGPLNTLATGNTGAVPDTVTDAPPSTTFVVIKFFIDNVLVGLWSKDDTFVSDVPGFATIKKGLNLNSTLGHTFWGNSEVANSIYVNGVATAGNAFLRSTTSGSIDGSLILTNNGGLTFGAANDFVGNVVSGTVILKNQTNNRDFVLSLKTGGNQQPFLRGNYQTGLAEAYQHPVASSPPLSFATKNYVDTLSGSVNGTANFLGNVAPAANLIYTLGNTTNRWSNVFAQSMLVGNVYAANTFATVSNVAQIYVSADITPVINNSSNIGGTGMQFNTIHARSGLFNTTLGIGSNLTVGGNVSVTSNAVINGNLSVSGNITSAIATTSTSTTTGALQLTGGAGIGGNLHVGENFVNPLITIPTVGNISTAGNITPSSNVRLTLGNLSYRWGNIFSESILVGNVATANIVAAQANVTQIYLNTDILPIASVTSNVGSTGMQFNTLHTRFLRTSSNVIIGGNANVVANLGVGSNITVTGHSSLQGPVIVADRLSVGGILTATGNIVAVATTPSTSTTTGALVVRGGAGIVGDVVLGGALIPDTDNTGFVGNTTNAWANGQFTNLTVESVMSVRGAVDLGDNDVLRFGTLDSWEFFHNGTDNYIDLNAGDLIIRDGTSQRARLSRTTGNLLLDSTTASESTATGAVVVRGGIGVAGVGMFGGNIVGTATTAATSATTGAIVSRGGLGVAGVGVFGGNIVASATTSSTNSTTGALVVRGGTGIVGRLNVDGNAQFAGSVNVSGDLTAETMPAGTANTHVATTQFVVNNAVPTGGLMMWATASPPTGYLLCNGAAISRTSYAALFAVLGTTFGTGNGTSTFNVPNYTNRMPIGAGALYPLSGSGGSKDAVVVSHSHTATASSTVTDPGHNHEILPKAAGAQQNVGNFLQGSPLDSNYGSLNTGDRTTGITVATTVSVASAGTSGTDANLPPYLGIYFIIKT